MIQHAADTADTTTTTDSSAADTTNTEVTSAPAGQYCIRLLQIHLLTTDENSEEDNSSSVKAVHTGDTTSILAICDPCSTCRHCQLLRW